MSVINQALKKAQKVKESRNVEFVGVLATEEREGNIRFGRIVLYSLFFIILIFFLFILYSSLEQNNLEPAPVLENVISKSEDENITTPEILYKRAKQLYTIGNIVEAKELYLKTLELDPGYTDALNNLGVICIHKKEYSSARRYFEKAIVLKPGYVIPYYNLACLLSIEGENEDSMMYLKKAVSLDETVREWAREDTDLKSLRGIPEFEEVIEIGFN